MGQLAINQYFSRGNEDEDEEDEDDEMEDEPSPVARGSSSSKKPAASSSSAPKAKYFLPHYPEFSTELTNQKTVGNY